MYKPLPFQEFIHYASADAIRSAGSQYLCESEEGSITHSISMAEVMKKVSQSDQRPCKNNECKRTNPIQYALVNTPEVITIGIVWNSDSPALDFIYEMLDLIGSELNVNQMFDSVLEDKKYVLRGMICYYGKHYNSYFKNRYTDEWLVFDDVTVKKVGKKWNDVVNKCRDGRFQPFILFYESPEAIK